MPTSSPSATLDPDTRLRQGQDHVATPIGGATAMMSVRRSSYYAVGGVAERIWQMLENPMTPREISAILQSEYDIDPERCDREVGGFLGEMIAEGLVEPCGS